MKKIFRFHWQTYNAFGALSADPSRGITSISYDNFGNPIGTVFSGSRSLSNVYSATGEKLKTTVHSNATLQADAALSFGMDMDMLSADDTAAANGVAVLSTTEYHGPVIYKDGAIDMVLYPGGYATVSGSAVTFHYYTQDYLGNNRAVINGSTGAIEQVVSYYPYGAVIPDLSTPTSVQPYKFGGKELLTTNGLNEYDFGARNYYSAVPGFTKPDQLCEKYYWLSPYLYCANNPVNAFDPDGNVIVFVNGFHFGDGGQSKYWNGIDKTIMSKTGDYNALYYDGALGGYRGLVNISNLEYKLESNIDIEDRISAGYKKGYEECSRILEIAEESGTSVKFVTHSMGSAYTKGLIRGMLQYGEDNKIDVTGKLDFEVDFAPFQPSDQTSEIRTIVFQHFFDGVAGDTEMPGATNIVTHREASYNLFNTYFLLYKEHTIKTFYDDVVNYWDKVVR